MMTSDNGAHWTPDDKSKFPHRANAAWRGMKADAWEGGHRIPFIARWPGKAKAGLVSAQLGCLTDLMASAAEMSGVRLPSSAGEDSYSWIPALDGRKGVRDAVVHHSSEGMFAIRQGEWKLIEGLGSGGFSVPKKGAAAPGAPSGQLYNLAADPAETQNVYAKQPDIVRRLTATLDGYRNSGRSTPA
jgi:arylsulfatase A-like enzyme